MQILRCTNLSSMHNRRARQVDTNNNIFNNLYLSPDTEHVVESLNLATQG